MESLQQNSEQHICAKCAAVRLEQYYLLFYQHPPVALKGGDVREGAGHSEGGSAYDSLGRRDMWDISL